MVQDMLMNIWRRGIKHTLFKYETPRSLGIIDWRLGVTDKVITIIILISLVINLGFNKEGLKKYGTVGSRNFWGSGSVPVRFAFEGDNGNKLAMLEGDTTDSFKQYQREFYKNEKEAPGGVLSSDYTKGKYAFCNDPEAEFQYDSEWNYGPLTCAYPDLSQMWFKGVSDLYVNTLVENTKTIKFKTHKNMAGLFNDTAFAVASIGAMSITLTGNGITTTPNPARHYQPVVGMGVTGSGIAAGTVVTSWHNMNNSMGISKAIVDNGNGGVTSGQNLTITPTDKPASSDDECQTFCDLTEVKNAVGVPDSSGSLIASFDLDRCQCYNTKYDFMVGADAITVAIDHRFESPIKQLDITAAGYLPGTVFRLGDCVVDPKDSKSCDIFTFEAGTIPKLPIQTLLDRVGIDLDGDNDACDESKYGTEGNRVNGKCPKARITGIVFDITMHYFNNDLSEQPPPDENTVKHTEDSSSTNKRPPYCIVELTPTVGWNGKGNMVTEKTPTWATGDIDKDQSEEMVNNYFYGIGFRFKPSQGVVGQWDWAIFLDKLIASIVMLSMGKAFTLFIAKYCLGHSSRIYKAAIMEEVLLSREVAKWAADTLAATATFHQLEMMDGKAGLSVAEIYGTLSSVLEPTGMDKMEIAHVASILFDKENAGSTNKNEEGEHILDVTKFADICTDDRITYKTLSDMVNGSKFSDSQRQFYGDLVAEHESNGVQMERGIKAKPSMGSLLKSFSSAAKQSFHSMHIPHSPSQTRSQLQKEKEKEKEAEAAKSNAGTGTVTVTGTSIHFDVDSDADAAADADAEADADAARGVEVNHDFHDKFQRELPQSHPPTSPQAVAPKQLPLPQSTPPLDVPPLSTSTSTAPPPSSTVSSTVNSTVGQTVTFETTQASATTTTATPTTEDDLPVATDPPPLPPPPPPPAM